MVEASGPGDYQGNFGFEPPECEMEDDDDRPSVGN